MMTLNDMYLFIKEKLHGLYDKNEIDSISRLIFKYLFDFELYHIITKGESFLYEKDIEAIKTWVHRLQNDEPIQYILGETEFYDLNLMVNKNVLIPRQETEELVHSLVTKYKNSKGIKILDIGTGSGCISIAIKKNIPTSQIWAIDISKEAIEIATKNASTNNVEINFSYNDIFNWQVLQMKFDVIISNPPYVCERERKNMAKNVLNYEPHEALFVADDNPLIFYEQIAQIGIQQLKDNGAFFLEINKKYGNQVRSLLKKNNFTKINILKDMERKDRIVLATKK